MAHHLGHGNGGASPEGYFIYGGTRIISGSNLQENLAFLRHILDHFRILQDRYGMRSMTMAAVADEVLDAHGQSGAAHQ